MSCQCLKDAHRNESERYSICCSANFLGHSPEPPSSPTDRPPTKYKIQVAIHGMMRAVQQPPSDGEGLCCISILKTLAKWRSLSAKAELSGVKTLSTYERLSTCRATPIPLCSISRRSRPSRAGD